MLPVQLHGFMRPSSSSCQQILHVGGPAAACCCCALGPSSCGSPSAGRVLAEGKDERVWELLLDGLSAASDAVADACRGDINGC
jgi:hypothetical protein